MKRDEALDDVKQKIVHDRQETYGDSVTQLTHCQLIKNAVGHHILPNKLNPTELEALDMICTKLYRIVNGRPHEDSWLDIIGYAAIAVESRHLEEQEIKSTQAMAAKLVR